MNNVFMDIIQLHERIWGNEQYPGRPSLADLLNCPIVVMWVSNEKRVPDVKRVTSTDPERFFLTAHKAYEELDDLATSIILTGRNSRVVNWKISQAFVEQKLVKLHARMQILDR